MNLLITGAWQGFQQCEKQLKDMGHEIAFMQWEKDPLPCKPEWVEGVIGNGIFQFHPIEQFINLKYIQLTSAGFDRAPVDYVREHMIEIYNAKGVYSIPMAEFAIGGILQLYKHFPEFRENQCRHEWNKIRNLRELNQSKVLIIGCGDTGRECAKRLKAFGCHVTGLNRTIYKDKAEENAVFDRILPLTELDAELGKADIVILTIALTDSTVHIMNRDRIQSMKDESILVNIARGKLVDQNALEELIPNKGMGAVLDVFEEEPLAADSNLWKLENVLVTPHNSFISNLNVERMNTLILHNLKNYKGE